MNERKTLFPFLYQVWADRRHKGRLVPADVRQEPRGSSARFWGERRSWRAGAGCKPVASLLRAFESLLAHIPGGDAT